MTVFDRLQAATDELLKNVAEFKRLMQDPANRALLRARLMKKG